MVAVESVNPGAVDVFRLNVASAGASSVGGVLLKYTQARVVSVFAVKVLLSMPSQPSAPFKNLYSTSVPAVNGYWADQKSLPSASWVSGSPLHPFIVPAIYIPVASS